MAVLALVLVLAAACSAGPDEQPSDRVCDDTTCISVVKLGQSLDRQLQGYVVGYVVLVGSSQVFADGQARKDSDPPSLPYIVATRCPTQPFHRPSPADAHERSQR